MIVLSKDCILEDYFIDENSVITDKNGNVQKQYVNQGRYFFKQQLVYKIMMNTFVGVKDGDYVVHHLDQNPLNNKLSNLIYLTREEHTQLHKKGNKNRLGKHHSAESKAKIRAANLGHIVTEESKAKMRAAKWWTNGIKEIRAKSCP